MFLVRVVRVRFVGLLPFRDAALLSILGAGIAAYAVYACCQTHSMFSVRVVRDVEPRWPCPRGTGRLILGECAVLDLYKC
jgi:hypothetical protein